MSFGWQIWNACNKMFSHTSSEWYFRGNPKMFSYLTKIQQTIDAVPNSYSTCSSR